MGGVEVVEVSDWYGDYGRVRARFSSAALPAFHVQSMEMGACRLFEHTPGFCGQNCGFGICIAPDVCVPYPTYVSVGDLAVSGLKTNVSLTYESIGGSYRPGPEPPELFDPGDPVGATASGDVIAGFSLSAFGVAPLVVGVTGHTLTVPNGADFVFTWTAAPNQSARVRLTLRTANQGHGLPWDAIIVCDAPDTGSLSIPRELIEAFPEVVAAEICAAIDCPPSDALRYTRDSVDGVAGEIELLVGSRVEFLLAHPAVQ